MTWDEYCGAMEDVICLAACAVNGTVPEAGRVAEMDLSRVLMAAQKHMITAAVGMALESAGIRDDRVALAVAKAQRKNAILDADISAVLARFEDAGIWYMLLKGSVLKNLYPRYGMRQMADVDILTDPKRTEDVRLIMESMGFVTKRFGSDNHDIYQKPPVSNFEIHNALFGSWVEDAVCRYYQDVKKRLVRDEKSSFAYHFSPEDLYIYHTVHEYKHFASYGTGLRSLLDTYVILKHYEPALDHSYISAEMEKLEMLSFEERNRGLALRLFGGKALTDEDKELLTDIIGSGTYGKKDSYVTRSVRQLGGGVKGRFLYILHRMFPPAKKIKTHYPAADKHAALLPVFYILRLGKSVFVKWPAIRKELRNIFVSKDDRVS